MTESLSIQDNEESLTDGNCISTYWQNLFKKVCQTTENTCPQTALVPINGHLQLWLCQYSYLDG